MTALGMQNVADMVDTCFDGQSLVDYVQTAVNEGDPERYSLIFTDCSMPIMDGYEASRQINKIYKYSSFKPLIVAVTGHVEPAFL